MLSSRPMAGRGSAAALLLSRRDAQAEGRVLVGPARLAAVPSQRPSIAAEQTLRFDFLLGYIVWPLGVGRHIQRVGRTVDLAQKTSLAVVLPRNDRRRLGHRVENIGRADLDANVARDAAASRNDLDHAAAPQG